MTTLLPQTLDGIIEFAATHRLMMIAVDSQNDKFDIDHISNYQGEASLAIVECAAEKKLTERQLLQRWCQALMGYVPAGNTYDLVALLKRTINEYKRVTVFMNPQHLCKKEHGRYCSIQGRIETIRRIWDENNANKLSH